MQKNHVGGNSLVLFENDKVSYTNPAAGNRDNSPAANRSTQRKGTTPAGLTGKFGLGDGHRRVGWNEELVGCAVALYVSLVTGPIVDGLFADGNEENESQRSNVSGDKSDLEGWNELTQSDKKKVEVEEELELFI